MDTTISHVKNMETLISKKRQSDKIQNSNFPKLETLGFHGVSNFRCNSVLQGKPKIMSFFTGLN